MAGRGRMHRSAHVNGAELAEEATAYVGAPLHADVLSRYSLYRYVCLRTWRLAAGAVPPPLRVDRHGWRRMENALARNRSYAERVLGFSQVGLGL